MFVSHEHCARWCICRVPVPAGFLAGSSWLHAHCSNFVRVLFRHDCQYIIALYACGSRNFSIREFLFTADHIARTAPSFGFFPFFSVHASCQTVSRQFNHATQQFLRMYLTPSSTFLSVYRMHPGVLHCISKGRKAIIFCLVWTAPTVRLM